MIKGNQDPDQIPHIDIITVILIIHLLVDLNYKNLTLVNNIIIIMPPQLANKLSTIILLIIKIIYRFRQYMRKMMIVMSQTICQSKNK